MGDVRLILGDALDAMRSMPDASVDCVVTSPPYNLVAQYCNVGQFDSNPSLSRKMEDWYEDSMDEAEYQKWQRDCVAEMCRVCSGSVFYNHQVRYAWGRKGAMYHPLDWLREFTVWCEIIWDRGCGVSGAKRYVQSDQRIYMLNKPKVWKSPNGTTVWRIAAEKKELHPCPFPVELALRCIRPSTDEGMTVLDPFAGSGTTGVACIQTGRNFIGVEIDPAYFAIMERRVTEAQAVQPLFAAL